jgi:RNase H-fold protein (predicted Holliday junction resolvase)
VEFGNMVKMDMPPEIEFDQFMENLRTRFNVLNTSVFLLEDSLKSNTANKSVQYINKVNLELQRIRKLIDQAPDHLKP